MKFTFLLLIIFILPQTAASDNDTLPIGPSQYRLEIESIGNGQVFDASTREKISIPDIIKKSKDTDIFVIGEYHDNYECHIFQRDFIKELYQNHPKIIVGFEFFNRDDDESLELWINGKITEDEFLKKTKWYERSSLNYGYTRLVMDVVKNHAIKAIGLNLPRDILHNISRKGFDTLTAEEKKLFPTINIRNPEHEYFIKTTFGEPAIQIPGWFKNMYDAQKSWDVIMAESMKNMLLKEEFKGYKGVIIAGKAHVAYKLGIPFRYMESQRDARIATIVPVSLPEKKTNGEDEENPMLARIKDKLTPVAVFSRGLADFVFSVPETEKPYFPLLGFNAKMDKNGNFVILKVKEGSIADKNGIKSGDIIVSIDDIKISSEEQMRFILSAKGWNDDVKIEVTKKIKLQ